MKVGKHVVAIVVMSFATLCANAETLWFDAGISGYADWPTDGANVTVAGQGVWTNTQYAALNAAEHRLEVVSSDEVQDGLEFDAATRRSLDVDDSAILHAEVMFSQFSDLPAIVSGIKGAIVALAGENDGDAAYYGVVAAAEGDTNTWIRLEGETPDTNATVMVNIAVTRKAADAYYVTYSIGETVLSSGGETEFPINIGEATAMGAILRGRGHRDVRASRRICIRDRVGCSTGTCGNGRYDAGLQPSKCRAGEWRRNHKRSDGVRHEHVQGRNGN